MSEKEVKKLYQGITDIHEDLVEEAQNTLLQSKQPKRPVWVKWGAAAACICAVAAGGFIYVQHVQEPSADQDWQQAQGPSADKDGQLVMEDKADKSQTKDGDAALEHNNSAAAQEEKSGIRIPPMEIELPSEGVDVDMVAFFIYQGNCYIQHEWIEDADADKLVGERLGTASGTIDEWTSPDAYVELSGTAKGDFYEVKGMDPSFMLCMKAADGDVETYICKTGITFYKGADLYETKLHLSKKYQTVQYETWDSWHLGANEIFQLQEPKGKVTAEFIKALDAAEFMYTDEEVSFGSRVWDKALYWIYFRMENGMTVRICLCEDGYVLFPGIMDVCLKLPQDVFADMMDLLQDTGASSLEKHYSNGISLQDCMQNADFGSYIPSYAADEAFFAGAQIVQDTDGNAGRTKELRLDYTSELDPYLEYSITMLWAEDADKLDVPILEAGFDEAKIEGLMVKEDTGNGDYVLNRIEAGVVCGDVCIVLKGKGLDAGEAYQILTSSTVLH